MTASAKVGERCPPSDDWKVSYVIPPPKQIVPVRSLWLSLCTTRRIHQIVLATLRRPRLTNADCVKKRLSEPLTINLQTEPKRQSEYGHNLKSVGDENRS